MMGNLSLLSLLLVAQTALAQDPVSTGGDKYRVLLENDRVRVLAYSDRPGEKTHSHRHPAFVVVALAPFKRRLLLDDGRTRMREFKAGDVLYSDGEVHIGENVGDTPTQVIMIEMKQAAGSAAKCLAPAGPAVGAPCIRPARLPRRLRPERTA